MTRLSWWDLKNLVLSVKFLPWCLVCCEGSAVPPYVGFCCFIEFFLNLKDSWNSQAIPLQNQLKAPTWQPLQQGYAVLIHFSGEQFLTLFVARAWIQEGKDGQESVSAHRVYENSDLTMIIKFHLLIRCIYYSFYTTKTSDAHLVTTLRVLVVSRRAADLGWVGVTDISCRYTYKLLLAYVSVLSVYWEHFPMA